MEKPEPPPEATLLKKALDSSPLSARKIADQVGISDTRLRHIVNGYQPVGRGQYVDVRGPDGTVARIAEVLGVSPDQLRDTGRPEAADLIETDEAPGARATPAIARLGPALDEMRRWLDSEPNTESGDFPPESFLGWYFDDALVRELLDRLQARRIVIAGGVERDDEGVYEIVQTKESQREALDRLIVTIVEQGGSDAGQAEAQKSPDEVKGGPEEGAAGGTPADQSGDSSRRAEGE